MKQKDLDKVVGRAHRLENASMDTDGDGVINILDCRPYNPNKQGVLHTLARGAVRTFTKEGSPTRKKYEKKINESEGRSEERYEKNKEIKREAEKAYYEEKRVVAIKKARERARAPGLGERLLKGTSRLVSNPSPNRTYKSKAKKKGKKKTTYKKQTYKTRTESPKKMKDFDFTKLRSIE